VAKWCLVALMCLLVVILTATLAFGQEASPEFYAPQPTGQAGPAQIADPGQGGQAACPETKAPEAQAAPQGPQKVDLTGSVDVHLSGWPTSSQGGGHGHGKAKPKAAKPPVIQPKGPQEQKQFQVQAMYVWGGQGWVPVQPVPTTPPAPNAAPPGVPGTAGNPPVQPASGGPTMPWWWPIIVVGAVLLYIAWLNQRTNAQANAAANAVPARDAGDIVAEVGALGLPQIPRAQEPSSGCARTILRDGKGKVMQVRYDEWPPRPEVQQLVPGQAIAVINAAGNVGLHQADFEPEPEVHLHVHQGQIATNVQAAAVRSVDRTASVKEGKEPAPDARKAGEEAGKQAGEAAA